MQNIAKKFVEVMRDCSHVAKNGSNDFHRYKYATAADVLEKVNASLTKHGLATAVTPNILSTQQVSTAKGNVENLVTVEVVVMLIDPDSGETLTIKGLGSGQDAGDKAVAKAQTMAIKSQQSRNRNQRRSRSRPAHRRSYATDDYSRQK